MTHPDLPADAALAGRVWLPDVGPAVVRVEGDTLIDISAIFPTMRDLCEMAQPAQALAAAQGKAIGKLADVLENATAASHDPSRPHGLSPIDLQAVKAAGVTFAV